MLCKGQRPFVFGGCAKPVGCIGAKVVVCQLQAFTMAVGGLVHMDKVYPQFLPGPQDCDGQRVDMADRQNVCIWPVLHQFASRCAYPDAGFFAADMAACGDTDGNEAPRVKLRACLRRSRRPWVHRNTCRQGLTPPQAPPDSPSICWQRECFPPSLPVSADPARRRCPLRRCKALRCAGPGTPARRCGPRQFS